MFAILAAVMFGIAALMLLFGLSLGDPFTAGTLNTLGLLFVALHLTGAGAWRGRWRRR